MLFVIFVSLIAIGVFISYMASNRCYDGLEFCGLGTFVIGLIATLVSLFVLMVNHTGVDGKIAACNTRYGTLVYQYENDIYDNDNDLGKRELMEDIQSWNEDLARHKENQDDFWIGIYIPNIYDQFEFIELEKED